MTSQGRWRMVSRPLKAIGIFLAIGLTVWLVVSRGAEQRDIVTASRMLRLAPLPADAADVHAASIHNWTWRSAFVKFRASPASIDAFLIASPGLTRVKAEVFTPQHRFLPLTDPDAFAKGPDAYAQDAHFTDYARAYHLPWFDPTIKIKGRRYVPEGDSDDTMGEVVVDDVRHIVYVYADEG